MVANVSWIMEDLTFYELRKLNVQGRDNICQKFSCAAMVNWRLHKKCLWLWKFFVIFDFLFSCNSLWLEKYT